MTSPRSSRRFDLGRRIYDNIRKAMCYIVAVHVPTAGMSLVPLVFGWPLLFYPVHIVFLELVIDPACSIAFEAEAADDDVMRRPPRPASARLFDRAMLVASLAQGAGALVAVATLYLLALESGRTEPTVRAMGFAAIVLANIALIVGNRSRGASMRELLRPNTALWSIVGGAIAALSLAIYLPPVAELFRFDALTGVEWLVSSLPAMVVLAGVLVAKAARTRA